MKKVMLGALALAAATAWAANDAYYPTLVPAYRPVAQPAAAPQPVALAVDESLAPGESVVVEEPSVMPAPVVRESVPQPRITIENRRLTEDERIQAVVMDRIAANPRLSGQVSVQSNDRVVRLSGWTRTVGQAWQAERDARSVLGVRYVRNEIRPRVGGSV
jgi:hypothetical protein